MCVYRKLLRRGGAYHSNSNWYGQSSSSYELKYLLIVSFNRDIEEEIIFDLILSLYKIWVGSRISTIMTSEGESPRMG